MLVLIITGVLRVLFMIVLLMGEEVRARSVTDWEQTVKAAEKEGQVTVYISGYVSLIAAGRTYVVRWSEANESFSAGCQAKESEQC